MASSRSWENVVLNYFNTRWCIGVCIPLDLIWIYEFYFILWLVLSHLLLFLLVTLTDVVKVSVTDL